MINIQDIIPFMKKGWVAMDEDGRWCWYDRKPTKDLLNRMWWKKKKKSDWHGFSEIKAFDIAPADDWTKSLIKVSGKSIWAENGNIKTVDITMFKIFKKYKIALKALQDIASTKYDMNKLVGIAIKALKDIDNLK